MAENLTHVGVHVGGDLLAHDTSVVQTITNLIIMPKDPPPKSIRFKVENPIQTFTGREVFLEELHKVVKKEGQDVGEGKVTVLTQEPLSVVAATGGIGKTETVRMYIKLHQHEYDHIIWIDAEDASFAKSQFTQLATRLKISTDFEGKPKEFDLILTEIFEKLLQQAHVVLVVFDNAEALEDDEKLNLSGIRSLLPKSLSPFFVEPTIIVTSRNQNWSLQKVIQLDLWNEGEVVIFVIRRLGLETNCQNEALAQQLGTLCGRLPIALQAAVAVILQQTKRNKNKEYGIQNLIDEYKSGGGRKVLAQKPLDANMRPTQTSIPMLVLWNISLEKILKLENGDSAIKILCFMAYMSPTNIPKKFLHALFQQSCSTPDSFDNALEILEDYSLIASLSSDDDDVTESESRSFSIHRMIQDSTIENLRKRTTAWDQTPHAIFQEVTFLNETDVLLKLSAESINYIKAFSIFTISRNRELVENLAHITNHVSKKLDDKKFRDLTEIVGRVLQGTYNFSKSIELYERALEATPSSEILERIKLKGSLALAYRDAGRTKESHELSIQVLEDQTQTLGPHHEDTLNTKCEIANALFVQGKEKQAMGKYREVLQDFRNNGDTQSQSFQLTTANYANALRATGETQEALKLLKQVLKEQEKEPNLDSIGIINTKSHIASALEDQGKFKEASEMMLQIIAEATRVFRAFDLPTLSYQRHHATLLLKQGNHDQVAPILLELLEIVETHLGSEHPKTLLTKGILAALYIETEKLDKAVPLLDVEVREKVFGSKHPHTVATANNLAFARVKQNNFKDALALYKKIYKIQIQVLGSNHTDTLDAMHFIASSYYGLYEFDKAFKVAQDVLLLRQVIFGKNHPDTIKILTLITLCTERMKILDTQNSVSLQIFMELTGVNCDIGRSCY